MSRSPTNSIKRISLFLLTTFFGISVEFTYAADPPSVDTHCILFRLRPGHDQSALKFPADCISKTDLEIAPPLAAAKRELVRVPLFHCLEVPKRHDSVELFEQLKRNPSIEYVEYNGIGQGDEVVPNDPNYSAQWHHSIIGSPEAWKITQGSPTVTLAVLDTGLNLALPDYAGRIVAGYDFVNGDSNPTDDQGHGSAVTAVAAGTGNNGVDTAGIDWSCRIMPLKVLDSNNRGSYSDWAAAIRWAADNGADVINLSASGSRSSITLENAIDYAISHNVIFVTTTGNTSSSVNFPGRLPQAITVGATQNNDLLSSFSSFGPEVDIVAPGGVGSSGDSFSTNVTTTDRNGNTTWWWGTSFAAPQVAGAACLLRSLDPTLTHEDAEIILSAAADDFLGDPNDLRGFDNFFGYGRLNIPAAMTLLQSLPEIVEVSETSIQIQMPAPLNASFKQPFGIEFSDTLQDDWIRISTPTNMTYTSTTATWTDNGSETGLFPVNRRFYRRFIHR